MILSTYFTLKKPIFRIGVHSYKANFFFSFANSISLMEGTISSRILQIFCDVPYPSLLLNNHQGFHMCIACAKTLIVM